MPQRIELDGVVHEFPDDFSDADIAAALEEAPKTATPPPASATIGMMAQSTPEGEPYQRGSSTHQFMDWMNQRAGEQGQNAKEHPIATAAQIALSSGALPMLKAVPGVIGRMASKAGAALENPVVGGALGAAEGYRQGGVRGAITGGALGVTTGGTLAKSLKRFAPTPKTTPIAGARLVPRAAQAPAIDAAVSEALAELRPSPQSVTVPLSHPTGGGFTLPTEMPKASVAGKAKAHAPAGSTQSALAREVLMREPNWQQVDAVPIDAIKRDVINGGTIIESGESQRGLATRLADLLKKPTPSQLAEAERLAKALRQRGHISSKTSGG